MAEPPTDAILPLLMKIQENIGALKSEIGHFRRENDEQHQKMLALINKQRRDSAGMLVMMRATVTDFDERVNDVVERVAALEARKS